MQTRVFHARSVSATALRWALEPALSRARDKQGRLYASIKVLSEDSQPGYGIATLNVAGPRESSSPGVADEARHFLRRLLEDL